MSRKKYRDLDPIPQQNVAAECEWPHASLVLSTAPRAHTNNLRVSHGFARTHTQAIMSYRPIRTPERSSRRCGRSLIRTPGLHTHVIMQHHSQGCNFSVHFLISQMHLWPMCYFDLGGIGPWLGAVLRTNRSFIKKIHITKNASSLSGPIRMARKWLLVYVFSQVIT